MNRLSDEMFSIMLLRLLLCIKNKVCCFAENIFSIIHMGNIFMNLCNKQVIIHNINDFPANNEFHYTLKL